jgi:NAD(P)-dependent dehydrogenase (short-subunit alcohol dehydrogenase family)
MADEPRVTLRLSGRAAIVTGASRGIGESIARRFAREGAKVLLVARDVASIEKHAAELTREGAEAFALFGDVTDDGSVRQVARAASDRFGKIDVLVNNAGLGGPTPLDADDAEADAKWDAIVATNLTAVFRLTRAVAPHLSRGGRVINLSSVLGRFGVPGFAAYCASKHGVIGLTRALALELAPREITVNAICPGWVETEMARQGFERFGSVELGRETAAKMAPLKRVLEPEEIAGLAAYLASDDARSVTGQAIVADGGQVMP